VDGVDQDRSGCWTIGLLAPTIAGGQLRLLQLYGDMVRADANPLVETELKSDLVSGS
jgi:hypothetical protein